MLARVLSSVAVGALLISSPASAAAPANNGVTTIENPGGGTIAYAAMRHQPVRDALQKVLGYVHSHFGAQPKIGKVIRSKDGNVVAAPFTVSPQGGGKEISGLALVVVPKDGPAEGAMLSDTTDRFRTTFKSMYERLQGQAGAAQGAGHSSAAGASPPSRPSGPLAPPQALHPVSFPDGSGTISLPAGWNITSSHAGDVAAKGPNGEQLRFGAAVSVIDPTDPRSRVLGVGPHGTAPGNFVAIPFGTDAAATFKSATAQSSQKARRTPATFNFTQAKEIPYTDGGRICAFSGDVDNHDARGTEAVWVQMTISNRMALGGYQLTISEIVVPKSEVAKDQRTIAGIFHSYRPNVGVILGQINAEIKLTDEIFSNARANERAMMDASDLSTQGMSDYLRGDTVVLDKLYNGHGRVSDDLAQGLIDADPNRFETVPLSDYVKGIDY